MGGTSVRTFNAESLWFDDGGVGHDVNDLDMGDKLPLHHCEGAQPHAAIAAISMGLIIVSAGLGLAIAAMGVTGAGTRIPLVAMGATFSCLGVRVFLDGLKALLNKVEIAIDMDGVRAARRGLTGTRRWQAALGDYFGVLQDKISCRSGDREWSAHTLYRVVLKHVSDSGRDIVLYESPSSAQHRQLTEDFAELLGRPAVVKDEIGNFQLTAIKNRTGVHRTNAQHNGVPSPRLHASVA